MKEATFRDFNRMCSKYFYECKECPLSSTNNGESMSCTDFRIQHTNEAEEIISKWCEENPAKTYLQDFKEKFPNTSLNDTSNCCDICRNNVYKNGEDCDMIFKSCGKCWNEEMKE